MIVSKDTNPENDLYYLGAKIIEVINAFSTKEVDYVDIFSTLKSTVNISNNLYTLSLDWLFIVGAIELSNEGKIKKCF